MGIDLLSDPNAVFGAIGLALFLSMLVGGISGIGKRDWFDEAMDQYLIDMIDADLAQETQEREEIRKLEFVSQNRKRVRRTL